MLKMQIKTGGNLKKEEEMEYFESWPHNHGF